MLDPAKPFAILWDEAANCARLFHRPLGTIQSAENLPERLRAHTTSGEWLAGGMGYAALFHREPHLAHLGGEAPVWFGRFDAATPLDRPVLASLLEPWSRPSAFGQATPQLARETYVSGVSRVREYIASGDIYQANLSFPANVSFSGHPLALFAGLFNPAFAPHGGIVHDGHGRWWLSFSPELFFTLEAGRLTARPMKGTTPRLADPQADARAAHELQQDTKNRAENLMITDLLRNDLAHVSRPGSVRVPDLFAVNPFANVHQMTSTVTAALAPGHDAIDALAALFPCGSITGAPKFRAIEIIDELEPSPRGIFYGTLGWIAPQAAAAHFNVAIRTVEITDGKARLALGAGIVADSDPAAEWDECLAKGGYLHTRPPRTLIETMRIEPAGIPRLHRHLDRLQGSAARFAFPFDRNTINRKIHALPQQPARLRLLLSADGGVALHLSPLPAAPADPLLVTVAPLPLSPTDWRLHHKTGDRRHWPAPRPGTQETIFLHPQGLLTEGSYTSIFVERDGRLLTPPAHLGLLPGVLRAELLAQGIAAEAELTPADLADGFLLGNSLRGLMPARLAD